MLPRRWADLPRLGAVAWHESNSGLTPQGPWANQCCIMHCAPTLPASLAGTRLPQAVTRSRLPGSSPRAQVSQRPHRQRLLRPQPPPPPSQAPWGPSLMLPAGWLSAVIYVAEVPVRARIPAARVDVCAAHRRLGRQRIVSVDLAGAAGATHQAPGKSPAAHAAAPPALGAPRPLPAGETGECLRVLLLRCGSR